MSLSGRLALVTGGTSGIGEAVCRSLAAQGAIVVAAARRVEAAQKVAQSLQGDGKHCAMHVDVGDSSSVDALFENIRTTFPQPLSIVVNSAGICELSPIVDCTEEQFDRIIRINLKGAFAVTRAASREMLRYGEKLPEGGCAIVNMTSTSVMLGSVDHGAYAASKAGVEALTKSAAKELAAHGIRCNTVLPGYVDTPLTAAFGEGRRASAISKTPLRRAAKPEEIADAVVFLCSPGSSSYITGASLLVNGGLYM